MSHTSTSSQDPRATLFESIENLRLNNDAASSLPHALAIEAGVCGILEDTNHCRTVALDQTVLTSAALLHGVMPSYVDASASPSIGQEGVAALTEAESLLRGLSFIDPAQVELIMTLLVHCEDTVLRFPDRRLPRQTTTASARRYPLDTRKGEYLKVLAEADAIAHLSSDYLDQAIARWAAAGVPWVSTEQRLQPTVAWHESIAGNIRLISKRAVLDSTTARSREFALWAYETGEELIRSHCRYIDVDYCPELCPPSMQGDSMARMRDRSFDLEIVEYLDAQELGSILHTVALMGDRSLFPYRDATVGLVPMRQADLVPIATYMLNERLAATLELFDAFMSRFCFGLFDLAGLMKFRYNSSDIQVIAPPVVETHNGAVSGDSGNVNMLVDGLHRFVTAKRVGLDQVRVLQTGEVPYPLIALPVAWDSVVEYHEPPPPDLKRIYRFRRLADVPEDVARLTNWAINEGNCMYFFYRDLESLGSKGHRSPHDFDRVRAH